MLVFVVAYEAENTLARVIERVPSALFDQHDVEVLVIDDSSRDTTFEVGLRLAKATTRAVTVLFNPANQGYGGNQKLGYHYAVSRGFDVVVLLHGDGQYAPEAIPSLLQPIVDGHADAVFGSRMLSRGAAREGGMPLYKFVGNKILTRVQNLLLGSALSEFHSGFRVYRVSTLASLPFERNSNVFHFDTEIIIQLMLKGARIVEVPIPTYYGDEICRVNGLRYAKDVIAQTVLSRLQRLEILYQRKFDVTGPGNAGYDVKDGYDSSHTRALALVRPGSRVLDIGCGPGGVAALLQARGCRVIGVDHHPPLLADAFERFVAWDGQGAFPADEMRDIDAVLLLDSIEHFDKPERLLDELRDAAARQASPPTVVVTTANIVFLPVRVQVLLGRFNYGRRGILDLTHRRLFTFATLRALFEECGYRVDMVRGIPAPFPKALGLSTVSRALLAINQWLIAVAPGLFSYQILLVARPLPTVSALLDSSIVASRDRASLDGQGARDTVHESDEAAAWRRVPVHRSGENRTCDAHAQHE